MRNRRRLARLALLSALSLTGCGDFSGEREAPPPLPAIAPGAYISNRPPASSATDQLYWAISLPQGGRSRQAMVQYCTIDCIGLQLPVRAGLNGLSISFPAVGNVPAHDLAISVSADGLQLSYDTLDGLWQAPLIEVEP